MKEIRSMAGSHFETDELKIKDALKRILVFAETARKEGILALEEFIYENCEENFTGKAFLERGINYLCDGISPEQIERLLNNKILAETDRKKQFICLLYKTGIEAVQAGEPFFILKEELCSLFPESCEAAVQEFIEQIENQCREQENERKEQEVPEKFEKVHLEVPAEEKERLESLEQLVERSSSEEIRRMFRAAENEDICSLLLVGTVSFRERLLENMSSRLRMMMMEDVIVRGEYGNDHYEEEIENIRAVMGRVEQLLEICE